MCLEVVTKLSKHAKVQIGPRGLSSQFGLSITKAHNDLGECLHFSLDGACSCDLLKKGRSDEDSHWVLEDAAAQKLSAAVKRIGEDTKGFLFRAYWLGEDVPQPIRIKLAELVELIARNRVPRNVAYVVGNYG
jgi:hypothetical protein